jgi:hypothetical protein
MPPATAGWQQWAGKQHLQIPLSVLSPDYFCWLLPTFDDRTTKLHLHTENLTETELHLNLGHLVGFLCVYVCVVLFYFIHPLSWDNYRTTSEAPSLGLETEQTRKLLRLKIHCIWTWGFFGFLVFCLIFHFSFYFNSVLYRHISFIYLFFIFILIFF